jgi:hypothetical protein
VSDARAWFEGHVEGAPAVLVDRARRFLEAADHPGEAVDDVLAEAGTRALTAAIGAGAGRDAALDLLAADALITMALHATAATDPDRLGDQARGLRQLAVAGAPG